MAKTITMFGGLGLLASIAVKQRAGTAVDTQVASEIASGIYQASFTGLVAGTYLVNLVDSSGDINWADVVVVGSTETGYFSKELSDYSSSEIADAVLTRNVSNVEATAGEHTLATAILSMLEWEIVGTDLVIKRTDGTTVHYTKALSSATGTGDVITGLN